MRSINPNKHYIPKGPSFKTAKKVSFDLSGTKVELSLPPHKSTDTCQREKQPNSHYDIYSKSHYRKDPEICIQMLTVLARDWTFRGPWLVGDLARLGLRVEVIRHPINGTDFNLFHPPTFEEHVLDTLISGYGDELRFGISISTIPRYWQSIMLGTHKAINYEVLSSHYPRRRMVVTLPITREHYIKFAFWERKLVPGSRKRRDELVSSAPMEALVAKVISSIRIDRSGDSDADKAEAARQ